MQVCHTHRQLLSRCTLRWYSVGPSSAVAASDVQAPSRLKRPSASTFGGINIQNVVVPFRNKAKNSSRSNGSNDQSPDVRRMSQTERNRGMGRGGASSLSSWGDGLVSLSFASRLKLRDDKLATRNSGTEHHSQQTRSWKQNSNQAQHPQMHGHRRGQNQQWEHDDASQTYNRGKTESLKSASAPAKQQGNRTSAPSTDAKDNKPKASSMTRPSSSHSFELQSQSTLAAKRTKEDTISLPSSSNTPATQQPTTVSDRKARLATLSSTNLNALFRTTTNTPTTEISTPSLRASMTASADSARARVRNVLERSAGDYSRLLPRDVGVRKDASRLPALRAARYALGTQRDVSFKQRRIALHIIGGLVQPRREVRA